MNLLESKIKDLYGQTVSILQTTSSAGGCINNTNVITLSINKKLFIKSNTINLKDMLKTEASGLKLLKIKDAPRVPSVIDIFEDNKNQYLILEHIDQGKPKKNYYETLGRQLATLHKNSTSNQYGLRHDNYIGSTLQKNSQQKRWVEFYAQMRLRPQLSLAQKNGYASNTIITGINKIIANMDSFIDEPVEPPALVHGDLWSGNKMVGPNGEPIIIDPATYYGHRETDLAMTELFGGFPTSFYSAYNEQWPLEPGFEIRKDMYNLYHMLNHLNIFGPSYTSSVKNLINKFV